MNALRILLLITVITPLTCMLTPTTHGANTEAVKFVYIGTYTGGKSEGIYVARFDPATGSLGAPELAAKMRNPTFLALHPTGRFLYAVGEVGNFGGKDQGVVSAFSIDPKTGGLILLNEQPSGGSGPCHLALDRHGRFVLVANYGSGSVASLPLEGGKLDSPRAIQHQGSSVNRQRQAGPHAHFITMDPAERFVLACDLGLDQVLVYRLDGPANSLVANDPPSAVLKPGAGPRHLVFGRGGKFVYVINELDSTITSFSYDPKHGTLNELQTVSTLPADFKGNNSCAEIQMHPSGKFLYGSNRGHDSIAVFAVDRTSGNLKLIQHQFSGGKTPRHFAIHPSGRWLLAENQDSDNIVVFRVDPGTGRLASTGTEISVGAPVCVEFAPISF